MRGDYPVLDGDRTADNNDVDRVVLVDTIEPIEPLSTVHGETILAACGGSVESVQGRRQPVVECVIWTGWAVTSRLVPVADLVRAA